MRTTLKLLVLLGLLPAVSGRAWGDTIEVDVGSNFYRTVSNVPGMGTNSTTIHAGDKVRWTWRSGFHSVVSNTDLFESMLSSMVGFTFEHTFNTPGNFPYHCGLHGLSMAGTIIVQTKVTGTLTLEDCDSAALPLTFTFHPADNSGDVVRTLTPAANGAFSVLNLPAKNYTLRVKGAQWLAVSTTANTSSGNVTGLNLGTLRGGDANNDNQVDVLDLDALIQSFDNCQGDPNYLVEADFNRDSCVDVLDLDILIRNFDQRGA